MKIFKTDGWSNFLTKVGIRGRDARVSACPDSPVFLDHVSLENLYHGNDIAHRIVRQPAKDMTRKGISLSIEGGDPVAVTQELDSMRVLSEFSELITWSRLFGGAIMFVGADDGQSPEMPLNMQNISTIRFITVLDRHDVHIAKFFGDPLKPEFGKPELYEVIRSQEDTLGQGDRVGDKRFIHSSRVIRMDGTLTARRRRRSYDGWSDSVFVRMFSALRGYGGAWDTVEILLKDFAQAVFKMKGLAEAMAAHGESQVMKRMELMDTSRSVLRGILIDAEMEDFERKTTPVSGLPELLASYKSRLASAAEMPISQLFGDSASGLNSNGDGDRGNWFETVNGMQEEMLRPGLERFLEILFNTEDGPTGGVEPAVWGFAFRPLEELNEIEQAQIKKTTAETDAIYLDRDVLTADEVATSRFGGGSFSTETALDTESRSLMIDNRETPTEDEDV